MLPTKQVENADHAKWTPPFRQQLVDLLTKESAHAGFDAAVKKAFPPTPRPQTQVRGTLPVGNPRAPANRPSDILRLLREPKVQGDGLA